MGRIIYQLVARLTGKKDPYWEAKQKSNGLALRILPKLRAKVRASKDPLLTAVKLSIAGNIIDYGVKNTLNVQKELQRILSEEEKTIRREKKRLFDYPRFKERVKRAKTILILGDNAGEVVFDRLLIEEIHTLGKKRILYAVKEKPIINDATREDAFTCGLDRVSEVISSGSDAPGTVRHRCSKEFLKIIPKVDMVLSKGQGNFEALDWLKRPVFFLFMAKCPVVTREVGCDIGDIILLYRPAQSLRKKRKRGK